MQAAFEAAGWALDGQVHKEKLYYPAETPLVSALLEVYRDATGDNAPPKCIGGGTYAKMLPNVVAFGPLFAGDPVTEHQPMKHRSGTSGAERPDHRKRHCQAGKPAAGIRRRTGL